MLDQFIRTLEASFAGYYAGVALFALVFVVIPRAYERLPHVRRRKEQEEAARRELMQRWVRTGRWR